METLHPERKRTLRKTLIGCAVLLLVAALGFVGCESTSSVNGEVTSKSTVDLGKLIGGPVLAVIGVRLFGESRKLGGRARQQLALAGAGLAVAGALLLVWGITLI